MGGPRTPAPRERDVAPPWCGARGAWRGLAHVGLACAAVAAGAAGILATVPASAASTERRVALLLASPDGGAEFQELRYTANDIERLREVLTGFGGFADDDVLVGFGDDAAAATRGFAEARLRLANSRAAGDDTLFVFYYSGHAKDGALRLGETLLSLAAVKELTEATGARVRIAVIDACRAGGITRLKGASKGRPIDLTIEEPVGQAGQVLITASSADEDAQESDDVQGSFFTYYLTSGLRGAADSDADGRVTLNEAYTHAYEQTVASTVGTRGGVQHPSYNYQLRGAGDVVMTELTTRTSAIVLPSSASGHFVLFDATRRMVLAELDKQPGSASELLVAPGDYVVKLRESDALRLSRLHVGDDRKVTVDLAAMQRVDFADDFAKGALVSQGEASFGRLGIALSAAVGAQIFISAPARAEYFPDLRLARVELDFDNALRRHIGVRVDLGLGQSGTRALVLDEPYVGELRYRIDVRQWTSGVALTGTLEPASGIRLAALARVGSLFLTRRFLDGEVPTQVFSTLTPGVGLEAAYSPTRWFSAGVGVRLHYMFFNVDTPRSLTYLDGVFVLKAVLR